MINKPLQLARPFPLPVLQRPKAIVYNGNDRGGDANEPRPAAKCPWQRSDQANGTFCKRACQTLLED